MNTVILRTTEALAVILLTYLTFAGLVASTVVAGQFTEQVSHLIQALAA